MRISERSGRFTKNKRESNSIVVPQNPDGDWILTDYYGTLTGEVSHALDQLHNATNWGLTLIVGGLIAIISRSGFPNSASLYMLFILLVVTTHFSVRGMKGYINVIRFGMLQRSIAAAALDSPFASTSALSQLKNLIRFYHVEWQLPLTRRDVYLKGALELGFGYMIVIIGGLAAFTAFSISWRYVDWTALGITLALLCTEITMFTRSPYMNNSLPDQNARLHR